MVTYFYCCLYIKNTIIYINRCSPKCPYAIVSTMHMYLNIKSK